MTLSIVIPAHDEAATIGATLHRLSPLYDIASVLVVCNGCTDDTATTARAVAPWATVLEIPEGSKTQALRLGDARADGFPRLYLDADSTLDADGVMALADSLTSRRMLAVAPTPTYSYDGVSRIVRAHHRLWAQTQTATTAISGTGAMMVSEAGRSRFDEWPDVIGDDYFLDGQFADDERTRLADVVVFVDVPPRLGAYVRRRARVSQGNHDVLSAGLRRPHQSTGRRILEVCRRHPASAIDVPAFFFITAATRVLAMWRRRRGSHRSFTRARGTVPIA